MPYPNNLDRVKCWVLSVVGINLEQNWKIWEKRCAKEQHVCKDLYVVLIITQAFTKACKVGSKSNQRVTTLRQYCRNTTITLSLFSNNVKRVNRKERNTNNLTKFTQSTEITFSNEFLRTIFSKVALSVITTEVEFPDALTFKNPCKTYLVRIFTFWSFDYYSLLQDFCFSWW